MDREKIERKEAATNVAGKLTKYGAIGTAVLGLTAIGLAYGGKTQAARLCCTLTKCGAIGTTVTGLTAIGLGYSLDRQLSKIKSNNNQ